MEDKTYIARDEFETRLIKLEEKIENNDKKVVDVDKRVSDVILQVSKLETKVEYAFKDFSRQLDEISSEFKKSLDRKNSNFSQFWVGVAISIVSITATYIFTLIK